MRSAAFLNASMLTLIVLNVCAVVLLLHVLTRTHARTLPPPLTPLPCVSALSVAECCVKRRARSFQRARHQATACLQSPAGATAPHDQLLHMLW
jgi:hypothetical protein